MGLDDRDYMRDRRRAEREGARLGSASWIDRKGRVEHHGLWFDAKHGGHSNRTGRYRSRPRVVPHPWQKWLFLLMALSILIPMYGELQRKGWLPDFEKAVPFPQTGSVTVPANTVGIVSRSSLTIVTGEANAVVQLFDPATNGHALSIYVAAKSRVTVPVPSATYRMRLIEGQKWHGTTRYFGPNTSYETVAELMTFEPRSGHIIDLHRRPGGNLRTQLMLSRPLSL
ncbi:MAG: hypothetical protein B7Y89_17120 [Novosphingobium sp. 32-60-15]|uniref:hypothetical protein n=1 Tax=Novosphingobium sp. 32-60-15 TaxID=1970410 RepID=UPI000BC6822A|nr:hypothetical protein [Novosphingobium sp. 32-60-15]OYX60060.1 MAG: hypothetical protein B7Y89_17120 [Novosphingobium sp. 32-60-15]